MFGSQFTATRDKRLIVFFLMSYHKISFWFLYFLRWIRQALLLLVHHKHAIGSKSLKFYFNKPLLFSNITTLKTLKSNWIWDTVKSILLFSSTMFPKLKKQSLWKTHLFCNENKGCREDQEGQVKCKMSKAFKSLSGATLGTALK